MAHFRHPKLLEERLTLHGDYVINDPEVYKGQWRTLMPGCDKLCVDLGCGKGFWTTSAAKAWPNCLFVGIDHELMCISFAAEQAAIGGVASSGWAKNTQEGFVAPTNIRFVCNPAASIDALFAEGEIDHLFLNYPTPFPKKKETANRIVNIDHLKIYERLLAPGATLHFKTDSQPLFDYALDQLKLTQFEVVALTRDLYGEESEQRAVEGGGASGAVRAAGVADATEAVSATGAAGAASATGAMGAEGFAKVAGTPGATDATGFTAATGIASATGAEGTTNATGTNPAKSFADVDKLPSAYERKTLMRGAKIHALHAQLKDGKRVTSATALAETSGCTADPNAICSPLADPVSLYDYLPDDLDSIAYVPLGMENALLNMRNRRRNGHGGVWGE